MPTTDSVTYLVPATDLNEFNPRSRATAAEEVAHMKEKYGLHASYTRQGDQVAITARGKTADVAALRASLAQMGVPTDQHHDTTVYETINELGRSTDWVALARLRPALQTSRIDRATQDASLIRLARQGRIVLAAEDNQKTLRQADRDASIWLGEQYKHLVACQRS